MSLADQALHRPTARLTEIGGRVSSTLARPAVAWTLIYFRPTVVRFLEQQGGNAPAERLQAEARRWIVLNWIRVVLNCSLVVRSARRVPFVIHCPRFQLAEKVDRSWRVFGALTDNS